MCCMIDASRKRERERERREIWCVEKKYMSLNTFMCVRQCVYTYRCRIHEIYGVTGRGMSIIVSSKKGRMMMMMMMMRMEKNDD
jgi:hypothetical protein